MIARLGMVLVVLSFSSPARADERRRVILVPTELGGFFVSRDSYRRDVDLALQERLRVAQFVVPARSPLSPAEADCREFDCLARIADAHGASIVIAGRVVANQAVKVSYHLRVRVVEKVNGRIETREREKDCDNCTASQARDMLATLMSAVIANEPEPVEPSPVKPPPSPKPVIEPAPPPSPPGNGRIVTSPQPPITRDRFTRGERWALRVSGVVVGAVGIGLLAQGFAELDHHGDVVTRDGVRYRVDTARTGQPLFFSLGAATLLLGGALEALGWWPWRVKVSPVASTTGVHVQIEGRF